MGSVSGPIAPPPLSQHLRELASRRDAWLIIVRNFIPVVGIYFFGWSAGLVGLQLLVRRLHGARRDHRRAGAARDARDSDKTSGRAGQRRMRLGVVTWVFLVGIVGHSVLGRADSARQPHVRATTCASISCTRQRSGRRSAVLRSAISGRRFSSGYDTLPDNELKQRARWDVYLLVLRAVAMFMMAAHGLAFVIVPLMAILLSYFEIWPERVLGAVFGDPARLYRLDPGGGTSRKTKRER